MNARKAPSIRSLALQEWPEADRNGWTEACRPAQRLTRGGAAGHMAAVTQSDLANRYGLYLDFLDRSGWLELGAGATALVSPDFIASFIEELQERVSSVTVSRTIYKVRRAAECIAPGRDFAWLAEIGKDLVLFERPKDKLERIVLTERLLEAALLSFCKVDSYAEARPLARAFAARNYLMVALLAACPIRLRNFATLETKERFRKVGGTWWIFLKDTKSKRPDHRPVPDFLTGAIELYLDVHYPLLLGNLVDLRGSRCLRLQKSAQPRPVETSSALWISRFGGPVSYGHVEQIITETTRLLIGVSISPHLFRAAAATTAALHSQNPYLGTALLQHSDARITYESYVRANSLSVAREFAAVIGNLREL